jgi:hypothetical protein
MSVENRDKQREKLLRTLKALPKEQREDFRSVIRTERDDELLADLRYDFAWDPDPRRSTWQAIEINRLLTKRQRRREAIPEWVGIIIANLLALASLIVSIFKHA